MRLEYAVCIDGVEVTREGVEKWNDDPQRAAATALLDRRNPRDSLTWVQPADDHYPRGPLMAAAALKRAEPDALVTICVWPAD